MKIISVLVFTALIFSLGCASTPNNIIAIDRSVDIGHETALTRADFNREVEQNQLKLLSPTFADRAEKALNAAEENIRNRDSTEKVFRNLEVARAWFAQAKQSAQQARIELSQPLLARNSATEVNDPIDREVPKVDRDLAKASERVEDGKSIPADEKQDLASRYVMAQRTRLREVYLDPISARLDQAGKLEAKKFAPKSWDHAQASFQAAKDVLDINPLNRNQFLERVHSADIASQDLVAITQQANNITGYTPEDLVLEQRKQQRQVSQQYQSVMDQQNAMANQNSQLSAQVAGLKEKTQTQELLDKLQSQLSKDKAEILLNPEGEVTIRLKDLKFKTDSADLTPEAAVILSDVKSTLSSVNPKKLVVDGHTDATGSAQTNKTLSESRANTVADYLKHDPQLQNLDVVTHGYGSEKPLKNNKTKAGRAQNRRVEITIQTI